MSSGKKIPWWLVIVCFFSGALAPIGIVLLVIKLFGEMFSSANHKNYNPQNRDNTYRPPVHTQPNQSSSQQPPHQNQQAQGWNWRQNAQNVEARPASTAQSNRVYQTPPPSAAPQSVNSESRNDKQTNAYAMPSHNQKRLLRKIAPNVGRGLIITGTICLIMGAIVGSILLLIGIGNFNIFYYFRWGFMGFIISMMSGAVAGLPFLIPGKMRHDRALRCQTFYAMLKNARSYDIREMAAAVPCSYVQACKDLRWMIHQGFYPGAYIDASRKMIVFPGFTPEPNTRPQKKKKPEVAKEESKPGVFPDVERIRKLNDQIADEYVSVRMDKLEELTFKILSYVEANPEKEDRIRQFRQHYLPKTIKILESYANFERQGVHGANIRSAMKDVESIMDTLVIGFEKQLDMLFVDEALDVTTDINVLESMMGIQGLGSDDPFKLELYGEQ